MKKSTAKGERLNAFPPRSKTKQAYLLSSPLFNIIAEVLASAIRKKQRIYFKIPFIQSSK